MGHKMKIIMKQVILVNDYGRSCNISISALSSKEQELITKLKYYKEVFKNI